jgi:transposase-like protein
LILPVHVLLEDLSAEEKEYKWIKPEACPSCESKRFWGHGYRLTQFVGFVLGLWLKRYRCDSCKKIFTVRPLGYFERYQSATKDIAETLRAKLSSFKWPSSQTRQRAGQWLRRFICFVRIEYGDGDGDDSNKVSHLDRLEQLYASSCQFLSKLA